MKKISVVVTTYNEEENVMPMIEALTSLFKHELNQYDYELIFIDNCSTDKTEALLEEACAKDKKVKAIFNIRNFGAFNSPYYGLLQATGDCAILMACDFQDPVEVLPKFVKEWENGYKVVVGVKNKSKENPILYGLRSLYYKLIRSLSSSINQIDHFTGFGLYDRSFLEIMRGLKDSTPFLRGVVAEYGHKIKTVPFEQPKRLHGKTHHNFSSLYDASMLSFTSYTTLGLRIVTITGFLFSVGSFIIGLVYLIIKLRHWYYFNMGMAPVVVGMFFLGSVILMTLGLLGEYLISINRRTMKRPLVIEERRINFEEAKND